MYNLKIERFFEGEILIYLIKGIILDLDDTLYPEFDYVKSGFKAVSLYISKKLNYDEKILYSYLLNNFKIGVRGRNFDMLIKDFTINITVNKLVEIYRAHKPRIKCFPDATQFLKFYSKKLIL